MTIIIPSTGVVATMGRTNTVNMTARMSMAVTAMMDRNGEVMIRTIREMMVKGTVITAMGIAERHHTGSIRTLHLGLHSYNTLHSANRLFIHAHAMYDITTKASCT